MGSHVSPDIPDVDSNAQFWDLERVEGFLGAGWEGSGRVV